VFEFPILFIILCALVDQVTMWECSCWDYWMLLALLILPLVLSLWFCIEIDLILRFFLFRFQCIIEKDSLREYSNHQMKWKCCGAERKRWI